MKVRRTKELLDKKRQYETKKGILGTRNSYSGTDTDSVAMMMKDKLTIRPAYNETKESRRKTGSCSITSSETMPRITSHSFP